MIRRSRDIVTPTARQVLNRVAEGLRDNSPYRAWTITGPYGVGKSAFAVFLTRLFCPTGESTTTARHQLQGVDPALASRLLGVKAFEESRKGFFPILITARRAATSVCILQGTSAAVSLAPGRQFQSAARNLGHLLRQAQRDNFLDSAAVVGALVEVNSTAIHAGYSGVLLLIDEFGKLFEFAARSPNKADVFLLQQLAEQASRSADKPLLLLGLLHQSFEDYGQHLDMVSRREWAKIQGRYEDVAFLEPADQVIRMIASAIRWKAQSHDETLRRKITAIVQLGGECGIIPSGMRRDDFEATALAAYPLHPCTLVALPFLFRRFAQNERSLFSYLSSLEPFGFQAFLRSHELNPEHPHFVRLEHLFDYFTQNFGLGLFRQPQARRWMEAADVLDRKDALHPHQVKLVKSIGILNALGEFSPLSARKLVIHYALADTIAPSPEVATGLALLKDQSILIYRKFNETYRIWEGSDVDLDEKVAEGSRRTLHTLGLSATLARYLELLPLVARRHSFETGALRFFSVSYVDNVEELQRSATGKSNSDGQVVVCLSSSVGQVQQYQDLVKTLQPGIDNLLIAIPQDIGEIRSAASELAALRWVWENTPQLRDDRVSRRELALRIADAEQLLKASVHRLLDPRDDPAGSKCVWYYQGVQMPAQSRVNVSQLLSQVCNLLFDNAPRIRNELIVRRSLSSAAAAARRNLIEAMLTRGSNPALGIEGYPPERSMYESVLHATGIHAQDDSGAWHFTAPPNRHPTRLAPAWQRLSDLVFTPQPEPQPLDQLFRSLAAPPHGVMDGLHPVLLCAFMLVHADEVTLYREGTFLPNPGIADFETVLRRPELFAIAGTRVQGARREIVARLAKGLSTKPATVPVVRALFSMVRSLPELAWRTNRLPQEVKSLRQAFNSAKSPENFLFVELPQAIGLNPIPDEGIGPATLDSFFNKLNERLQALRDVTPTTLRQAQDHLLRACGFPPQPQGWQALREAAIRIEPFATNTELRSFLERVSQATTHQAGIASVVELVANAPLNSWTDSEVDAFPSHAKSVGILFGEAEGLQARHAYRALTAQLSPEQRGQAQKIQKQLREFLSPVLRHNSRQPVCAALLALAQQLQERED